MTTKSRIARLQVLPTAVLGVLAFAANGAGRPPSPGRLREQVRAYRVTHEAAILKQLADLLSIPNVAADPAGLERSAERIVEMLKERGLTARLLPGEAGGPPAVYGERKAPRATRTVAIYAHYDGQAVVPAQWASAPFTPTLRDGPVEEGGKEIPLSSLTASKGDWRLYARGASDDKAPPVALAAALDALASIGVSPTVNLKVFMEGEEEAGSPHLAAMMRAHRELLSADLWLLCDGPVHPSRRMQLYFGARGVTDVELTVYGPLRPLHSGHYGSWVPNPANLLAHLLASLRGEDDRILIPGFDDDVRPLTLAERDAVRQVPDVDADLRATLGLAEGATSGRLAESVLRPALNIRGILSGGVGATATNAVPTEARASIDFRLVPDQTPAKVRARVEAFLTSQGWHIVDGVPDLATRRTYARLVSLTWGAGYPPARTPLDSREARALTRTVEQALGTPIVRMPTLGGSIPMYLFQEILGAPVVGLPIANHDNNQHAANENLRLQNLWDAIEVYAGVLAGLD